MMRIYSKANAKDGDERTITKFLLFPVEIDNETRWLEKATILQKMNCWSYGDDWENVKFVNK
jgi:hypothetical protein